MNARSIVGLLLSLGLSASSALAYSGYQRIGKMHPDASTGCGHYPGASESTCIELCNIDSNCLAVVYDHLYNGCYHKTGNIGGWRSWPDGDTHVKQ